MTQANPFITLSFILAACGASPFALSSSDQARLQSMQQSGGMRIYEGQVVPEDQEEAAFRYERIVREEADEQVSTHLSYDIASEELAVAQQATHDANYVLSRYEEIHAQTGVVSSLSIGEDGRLNFRVTRGDEVERSSEAAGDPVVVGPTLFGFVLAHWDALLGGEEIAVRFAAADQGQTYGFTLRMLENDTTATTIEFRASSFFVRLGIASMTMTFDTATRHIQRYVGRVPPRLDGLEAFDATSTYEFFVESYR